MRVDNHAARQFYEEEAAHAKVEGDNPTIGLILCSEKNAAIARYSVLHEKSATFRLKIQVHPAKRRRVATRA